MTQEQALTRFQAMFPDRAERLSVERQRTIGPYIHGYRNAFLLWDWGPMPRVGAGLICSNRSWEHALAMAAVWTNRELVEDLINKDAEWPEQED